MEGEKIWRVNLHNFFRTGGVKPQQINIAIVVPTEK